MSEPIIISLIGIAGAVVGSIATMAGNFMMHWLKERSESKKEEPARELLTEMLNHNDYTWRKLETLMHVIGADEEKTKRLLLQVGARASEDGQSKWALKSRAPLNKSGSNA
ncbi:MAG: hypothetical protein GXP09_06630 [Gammaproteobacteria bacterium]|nr:hypothetical protein [Gammaproteobacteria bacterium]